MPLDYWSDPDCSSEVIGGTFQFLSHIVAISLRLIVLMNNGCIFISLSSFFVS